MKKNSVSIRDIAIIGIGSAILFVVQIALRFLPNIELVSLCVILFTLCFGYRTLFMIYIFALLEGVVYGFGTWWLTYLYVWTILFFLTRLFRSVQNPLIWAVIAAIFGMSFGILCSVPYFIMLGVSGGIAWIISGFVFDLFHCGGNFLLLLLLFRPLYTALKKIRI